VARGLGIFLYMEDQNKIYLYEMFILVFNYTVVKRAIIEGLEPFIGIETNIGFQSGFFTSLLEYMYRQNQIMRLFNIIRLIGLFTPHLRVTWQRRIQITVSARNSKRELETFCFLNFVHKQLAKGGVVKWRVGRV